MACHWTKLPDGTVVHINMGRTPHRRCKFCGKRWISRLCDHPVAHGKTCDAGMCDVCATNVGPETDYCPNHKQQQSLFGGQQQ